MLKRSWDYGGKSVHLGAELSPEAWARAVEEALGDARGGGFVAQERIFAQRRLATRIAPEGVTRGELYRDLSTYCGLGPSRPDGSVVRAAASPIVNILGGGGLAPVIPEDVAEALVPGPPSPPVPGSPSPREAGLGRGREAGPGRGLR